MENITSQYISISMLEILQYVTIKSLLSHFCVFIQKSEYDDLSIEKLFEHRSTYLFSECSLRTNDSIEYVFAHMDVNSRERVIKQVDVVVLVHSSC